MNINKIYPVKIINREENTKVVNNFGSGVLVKLFNDENDLILTCAHCVENIDIKNVEIKFYDSENSSECDCIALDYFYDSKSDIGAILIEKIHTEINVYTQFDFHDTEQKIFLCGYPAILKGKNPNCMVLEGTLRTATEKNCTYTIKLNEKINDTSSTSEKDKIEGFSGSPVYFSVNGEIKIIGVVNKIVSNNGEDILFNDINIIKIEFILRILRENGIIIFNCNNGLLEIKWIKGEEYVDYFSKNILVIGGSGAGKSSFIKSFASHGTFIDSTGDGQTTRSDIEYKFYINTENPCIDIQLLSQSEFVKIRTKAIELFLIKFLFKLIMEKDYNLNLEIDIAIKSNIRYLKEKIIEEHFNEDYKNKIGKFIEIWDITNEKNDDEKRNSIIELNKQLLNLLYEIKGGCNNLLSLKFNEINELKNNLLNCRGFFSYKEFDFLNNNEKISELIEKHFEDVFNNITIDKLLFPQNEEDEKKNIIQNFFKEIYNILLIEIKKCYIIKCQKCCFDINSISEDEKYKAARTLRVINGESITSMVSKITIVDSFSNEYAWIMDKLMIKELCFIDTCGLDHIETGETSKDILKKVFEKHNDNIKAIIYLKKLDSGRPTELERIIPTIYKIQSNAAVYCVLNGIDLLYTNEIDSNRIINWENMNVSLPNSVKYVLSDEGKNDILNALKENGIRRGRSEILYSVLSRNLIPYCSNIDKDNNKIFLYNNMYHIKKLFNSIILEEHLGLEIIQNNIIEFIENKDSGFNSKLEMLVEEMFEKASITDWTSSIYGHGNHMTKKANIKRINKNELGFDGMKDDRWNQKFKKAYENIFSYENINTDNVRMLFSDFNDSLEQCYDKLEGLLIDFKDELLGCPKYEYSLFKSTPCEECSSKCFRNILLKMYNEQMYQCSINKYPSNVSTEKWLNEICDFKKGFPLIKEDILKLFKEKFLRKVKNENSKNINLILNINTDIKNNYNKLIKEIESSFLGIKQEDKSRIIRMVFEHLQE